MTPVAFIAAKEKVRKTCKEMIDRCVVKKSTIAGKLRGALDSLKAGGNIEKVQQLDDDPNHILKDISEHMVALVGFAAELEPLMLAKFAEKKQEVEAKLESAEDALVRGEAALAALALITNRVCVSKRIDENHQRFSERSDFWQT